MSSTKTKIPDSAPFYLPGGIADPIEPRASEATVQDIPVQQIEADPGQPRKTFDHRELGELAASIRANGLLQPITVRVGKEIKLDAIMGMKDADSAEEFNGSLGKLIDTANTFLPFIGNMQPKSKGLIDDLTKTLKAKAKDKDVTLTLAIQAESIGSAMGKDE